LGDEQSIPGRVNKRRATPIELRFDSVLASKLYV
jgi:hypothetical protein